MTNRQAQIDASWDAHRGKAPFPAAVAAQKDAMFRARERFLLRKEVNRLHFLGRISNFTRPQMLVKDASGRWTPELRIVS